MIRQYMLKTVQAKSWLLIFLLGIAGCSNSDASSQAPETANSEVFQHPIFLGLSEICLPFIEKVTQGTDITYKEAIAEIETLTHTAGFKKGRLYNFSHRVSYLIYSLGNKEHGAEVEVTHTNYASSHPYGRNEGQQCSSSFYRFDDYPSPEEFTRWLQLQDSDWLFNVDKSDEVKSGEVAAKYLFVNYCKNENKDFQQSLSYQVTDIDDQTPDRKPFAEIIVRTTDTKHYPQSPAFQGCHRE